MEAYSGFHPVNEILTEVAVNAVPRDQQLIARNLCPPIPVDALTGQILVENIRNFAGAGDLNLKRAPGADRQTLSEHDRGTPVSFSLDCFSLQKSFAIEHNRLRDYSQFPTQEETRVVRSVSRAVKLAIESEVAGLITASANWSNAALGSLSGGTQVKWDLQTGKPLYDLTAIAELIRTGSGLGVKPDTVVMGHAVALAMTRNAEVRGLAGTFAQGLVAGPATVTFSAVKQAVAMTLDISPDRVFIGSSRYASANAGQTSPAYADTWGDYLWMGCLLGGDPMVSNVSNSTRVTTGPVAALALEGNIQGAAPGEPGMPAMLAGLYDNLPNGAAVRRYAWVDYYYDVVVLDTTLGYLVTDLVG